MSYTLPSKDSKSSLSAGIKAGAGNSLNLLKNSVVSNPFNTKMSLKALSEWVDTHKSQSLLAPNMVSGPPYKYSELYGAKKMVITVEFTLQAFVLGTDYYTFTPVGNGSTLLVTAGTSGGTPTSTTLSWRRLEDGVVTLTGSLVPSNLGTTNLGVQIPLTNTVKLTNSTFTRGEISVTQNPTAANGYAATVMFRNTNFTTYTTKAYGGEGENEPDGDEEDDTLILTTTYVATAGTFKSVLSFVLE